MEKHSVILPKIKKYIVLLNIIDSIDIVCIPRKSEIATVLKQRMMNQQFLFPLLTWEKPYQSDICTELNVEKYQLRKDGNIGYSHPNGTHDDVFWSISLAIYDTVEMEPEQFVVVVPR
jgi:hypothetical protein